MIENSWFRATEVDQAPDTNGIYIWKLSPFTRKIDLESLCNHATPLVVEQWYWENLMRKMHLFAFQENTNVQQNEAKEIINDIVLKSYSNVRGKDAITMRINIDHRLNLPPPDFERIASTAGAFRFLLKGFNDGKFLSATPPLYIGKTTNGIQHRIKAHLKTLQKWNQDHSQWRQAIQSPSDNTEEFGKRAAFCNIKDNDLWFSWIDFELDPVPFENLFNRSYHPLFGIN